MNTTPLNKDILYERFKEQLQNNPKIKFRNIYDIPFLPSKKVEHTTTYFNSKIKVGDKLLFFLTFSNTNNELTLELNCITDTELNTRYLELCHKFIILNDTSKDIILIEKL